MIRPIVCVAVLTTVALGLALPQAVHAQAPGDRKYCDELVDLYRAYVSDPSRSRNVRATNAQDEVAISKCQSGDTATGIPTLEKALRDQKINLPPHG